MFHKAAALVLAGIGLIALVTAPGSYAGYLPWLEIFQLATPLLALAAVGRVIWLGREGAMRNNRSVWLLMAFAAVAGVLSAAINMYFEYQYAAYPIYPAPSDILLLLELLLLAAASYAAARKAASASAQDASPAATAAKLSYIPLAAGLLLAIAVWIPILFVLVPVAEKVTAMVTLVIDSALIFATWRLVNTLLPLSPSTWRNPWTWLALGSAVVLVGDISFAITAYLAVFNPAFDLLQVFAFLCWTWSALIAAPAHK